MAIDGGRLDAEAARDLFGIQMGVNEAQAFTLAVGQSISAARHPTPPGSPENLNHGREVTETGISHAACNRRLPTPQGVGEEIAMEA